MANNKVQEMSFYKVNEEVLKQIASITSGDFMKKNQNLILITSFGLNK